MSRINAKRISYRILAATQLDLHSLTDNNEVETDEEDLWAVEEIEQEFDSAETSLNQIPSTFKKVAERGGWVEGTLNCDIGGGREFDEGGEATHKFTAALKSVGVTNAVFDPFNRTVEHNQKVAKLIKDGQADTVTVNNVLNVIKEPQIRSRVIRQAANALKDDGTAYFLIYQGNKSGNGKMTRVSKTSNRRCWQNNLVAKEYLSEVGKYFSSVKVVSTNLIIAQH